MSESNVAGRVLGSATTTTGVTMVSAVTGHHTVAAYCIVVAIACGVLVMLGKIVGKVVVHLFAKPY